MQVVAGDLLQQDVEAIASALGRAPIGVGNTPQTAPIGPFHALASWFGAAFGQTSTWVCLVQHKDRNSIICWLLVHLTQV